ncbi:hypothetical protein [Paenibacillus sp. YYML68]|uniref:hypothetical protein n=1 Tax=Paenibacillus sp. YYML68 TaxID=2909250 RepID=UPI0024900BEA|nr:hypothetical protein [Paenibacillus sp. YYML68]
MVFITFSFIALLIQLVYIALVIFVIYFMLKVLEYMKDRQRADDSIRTKLNQIIDLLEKKDKT